jgi:hypothetical protein
MTYDSTPAPLTLRVGAELVSGPTARNIPSRPWNGELMEGELREPCSGAGSVDIR